MLRTCLAVAVLASLSLGVRAETLLVDRVKQANIQLPRRGMGMADVQARFGQPASRLEPRGGQNHHWPTINRWVYPAFTVYFERSRVIDAVVNKADPTEIGPKPPIR